jgi:hypothetical protein
MVRSIFVLMMLLVTTAYGKRTAAPVKEPPPPQKEEAPEIDQGVLNAVVERNKIDMKICYQRALKRESDLRVKVVAKLKIAEGHASVVDFGDKQLHKEQIGVCLSDAFRRWEFPLASKEYAFEFPVVLMRD